MNWRTGRTCITAGVTLAVLNWYVAQGSISKRDQSLLGKELYTQHCNRCHGIDGTKGRFGAKNLKRSRIPDSGIESQIQNGKGFMPSFKKKLQPDELSQLVQYVKTLRSY